VRDEPTLRHRALLADVRRDLGRTDWAVAEYTELIEQCRGTAREALMWQHLGKAHFVGQDYPEAAEAFEKALDLRLRDTAPEDLVASSRMALQRTRSLLPGPSR
jgi:tetratricopeptide (TPR) repeat protein